MIIERASVTSVMYKCLSFPRSFDMRSILALSMTLPLLLPAQPSVDLSENVAAYAEAHMGTKVGRGECWDLAENALNEAGAQWDGHYVFGLKLDTTNVPIQRGDIVQFEGVLVEHGTATSKEQATMGHHTAIVLSVPGPGRFMLAHQNFGRGGRKVSRYELVMADVKRGVIMFFRPID